MVSGFLSKCLVLFYLYSLMYGGKILLNLASYFGFDYLELAPSPKILGDFKPNSDCNLWLAPVVVFVGQKS